MGSEFKIDGDLGTGRLSPGVTDRRWLPKDGIKKHNEQIHKESKYADEHKNLPFSFSKPKKFGRMGLFECIECGHRIQLSINAVGLVCPICKKFVSVSKVPSDA